MSLKIRTPLDLWAHTADSEHTNHSGWLLIWLIVLNGFYYSQQATLCRYSAAFTYSAIYCSLIRSLVTRAKRQRWILESHQAGSLTQARVKTNTAFPSYCLVESHPWEWLFILTLYFLLFGLHNFFPQLLIEFNKSVSPLKNNRVNCKWNF